jgi:hypothetical protein
MTMKRNLSLTDSMTRIVAAIVIAILFLSNTVSSTTAIWLGGIAFILFATGVIKFCPLYWISGISTNKKTA